MQTHTKTKRMKIVISAIIAGACLFATAYNILITVDEAFDERNRALTNVLILEWRLETANALLKQCKGDTGAVAYTAK
jgi:hypothetical protein